MVQKETTYSKPYFSKTVNNTNIIQTPLKSASQAIYGNVFAVMFHVALSQTVATGTKLASSFKYPNI
jgi:hypothetical protein